jgi:alkylated DNA repair dioxygenase AlkB
VRRSRNCSERFRLCPSRSLSFTDSKASGVWSHLAGTMTLTAAGWAGPVRYRNFSYRVRERAARFVGIEPPSLEHTLVIEYAPGAAIGWHRDRPTFEDVIGISLVAPCTFRLRRKTGARWERRSFTAEPRSAYLLRGPSRTEWEHSIPPLDTLRYSVRRGAADHPS